MIDAIVRYCKGEALVIFVVISLVGKPTGRLVFSNWREEFESANENAGVYLVHFGHTHTKDLLLGFGPQLVDCRSSSE